MDSQSPYSALDATDQEQVSQLLADLDTVLVANPQWSLETTLAESPAHLRAALLSQALPALIDSHRTRHGVTPTLYELRLAYPNLAQEISEAYQWIPESYQLPVELRGYRVLAVIGEGGQSVVLRAQDDVHSAVAIKVSTSVEHNEYVLRERKLLGECDHPGIVRVINSGNHEGRAYFVMPYLRGATLADRFAVRRPTSAEVIDIMRSICSALAHLHSHGIVHRDIKPANVWLDEAGNIKLIDLGMAIQRTSWSRPLPQIGEFNGTPAFMSPEQAASDGSKDSELSDVFSTGATLYWMMTGLAPFAAETAAESISLAAAGEFDKSPLLNSREFPSALKRLCLQAMATEPANRFTSAKELSDRLQAIPGHFQTGRRVKVYAFALLLLMGLYAVFLSGNFSGSIADSSSAPEEPATPPIDQIEISTHELGVNQPTAAPTENEPGPEIQLTQPQADFSPEILTPLVLTPLLPDPAQQSADEPTPAPLKVRWIDRIASDHAIAIDSISAGDFVVSAKSDYRVVRPDRTLGPTPAASGELLVQLNKRLLPFSELLEYRLGNQPWSAMKSTDTSNTYAATLVVAQIDRKSLLDLRFRSDPTLNSGTGAGPFHFNIKIRTWLEQDKQQALQELSQEAATAQCFDTTASGWNVTTDFSSRYSHITDEFWFGVNRTTQMQSLAKFLHQLTGVPYSQDPQGPRYTLQQAFALASKDYQSASEIWVKFRLIDGTIVGPTNYRKSLDTKQETQRAQQWLEQPHVASEVANLQYKNFTLTGLGKYEHLLSSIRLIATYDDARSQFLSKSQSQPDGARNATTSQRMPSNPQRTQRKVEQQKSEVLEIDLNARTPFEPIQIPPLWDEIHFRGVFKDGSPTPLYTVKNSSSTCGTKLPARYKSKRCPRVESYLYISFKEEPDETKSISRFMQRPKRKTESDEALKTTRLRYFSTLPPGAVRAEYFADKSFKSRLTTVQPGELYVRYLNDQGVQVGYSVHHVDLLDLREMADHAQIHIIAAEVYRKFKTP